MSTSKFENAHIILNPIAGGGKAKRIIPEIKDALTNHFDSGCQLHITKFPKEATKITRQLLIEKASMIVSVGGDGTVHEIVNGIFEKGVNIFPGCELGIINCGTGADLNKSLNLPESIADKIKLLTKPICTNIDIGVVSFTNKETRTEERYFINECQIGIGGSVVKGVSNTHKYLGGKLAFGTVTLKNALLYRTKKLKVTIDPKCQT